MIPVTYPSSLSAFNRRQMEIYPITLTASQIAWTDYIPVRFNSAQYIENTTDNAGYMAVNVLSSTTGKQAWVDYVPVVIDSNRTDAWQISANGYIPVNYSGTGDGTAANKGLSLNFLGADRLDPRITFSRASNATVTGSNGLIQYAPHNLLTFSEQFDNAAWSKNTPTITANATVAPNGTTTADLVTFNTQFGRVQQAVTLSSGVSYTVSFWAKNNTGTNTYNVWDNTTNVSLGTFTPTNEWVRYSFTFTIPTSGSINLLLIQDRNASGFGSVFLWGAQLEIGSTATTYNPTTVKNLLGFSEAFDNAAWTKSNSFIQTNLLLQSEAFDSASWNKQSGCTVTANSEVSPNGTMTADLVTTTSNELGAYQIVAGTTSTTYTASIYAKAGTSNILKFGLTNQNESATQYYGFNLTTQEITLLSNLLFTNNSSSIASVGNGWYRCTVTATSPASGVTGIGLFPRITVTGNLLIWGAQLVQGSVAGDYQQTTSSALAVMYQAPNGTLTADKLVENTANSQHLLYTSRTGSNIPATFSIYAKKAEREWLRLVITDSTGTDRNAYFDLTNGVLGTVQTNLTGSITSVGNGWYRCSVTVSSWQSGSTIVYIAPSPNNNATFYTGDGTSGLYIWGAQLSDSASLDQYVNNPVAAPSSTAYYGPRFDYDPVTLQPRGLLIEEQRVNLVLRSEEFDNASWTKTRVTVTANAAVSPDGTQDADKIVEDTSNNSHFIQQNFTGLTSGASYTWTTYVKAGERTFFGAVITDGTFFTTYFNLATGELGTVPAGVTASITPAGNGWYRCSVTRVISSTTLNIYPSCVLVNGNTTYQGDGTSGLFVWGAQLEAGAFATSYIPTVASQVTRSVDNALIQGSNFSSFYNVNEGSAFTAFSTFVPTTLFNSNSPIMFSFNDNTTSNRIDLFNGGSVTYTRGFVSSGGVTQASMDTLPAISSGKAVISYQVNNFASSVAGASVVTDTSGTVPTVSQLQLGRLTTALTLNGHIRQIAYYPRRLQNSELVALTS